MIQQLLASAGTEIENILLSDEWLLAQNYLTFSISYAIVFLVNYIFGALAVSKMMARYGVGKSVYAWIPALRYYYLGKLAYNSAANKEKPVMGIVVSILYFISTAYAIIINAYLCIAAYQTNVEYPISSFYEADELFWLENFESLFVPSWLGVVDTILSIAAIATFVCAILLFRDFFRRFKFKHAGWFTFLSAALGLDGVFIFAVRNNQTVEEMFASGGFRPATPFGNYQPQSPYGNPNGQQGNPYGNPNPYGQQGNPYGNPNPYGQQGNPYGNPNPYGQQGNPYGNPNPYGQQGNPYGNPNPYGQQGNPYGQPFNPYGAQQQPQNNGPFSAPNDPYAQPGSQTPPQAPVNPNPFSEFEGGTQNGAEPSQSPQNSQTSADPFSEFESDDKGQN